MQFEIEMFIFEVPAGKPNKGETMNHKLEAKRVRPSVPASIHEALTAYMKSNAFAHVPLTDQAGAEVGFGHGYAAAMNSAAPCVPVSDERILVLAEDSECIHPQGKWKEQMIHFARAIEREVLGRPTATSASVSAIDLERLPEPLLAFASWLNEPPSREVHEPNEVRNYRHEAYHRWQDALTAARALLSTQPASVQGVSEKPFPLKMADLVNEAHRRILAALPEDEPDCVPDWVCELLITLGYEQGHMEARASQPAAPAQAQIVTGLTPKQEWWAGYRAGKGLPPDTPRQVAVQAVPSVPNEQAVPAAPDIKEMVNRFLGWRLPQDFHPDCGISFDGRKDDEWYKNKTWPIGTNLLTADQAKAMFEYCLQYRPQAAPSVPDGWMKFHKELGQMRWMGADEGWDSAIEAVRKRLLELAAAPSAPLVSDVKDAVVAILGERIEEAIMAGLIRIAEKEMEKRSGD